jgi:hypothetical protein
VQRGQEAGEQMFEGPPPWAYPERVRPEFKPDLA